MAYNLIVATANDAFRKEVQQYLQAYFPYRLEAEVYTYTKEYEGGVFCVGVRCKEKYRTQATEFILDYILALKERVHKLTIGVRDGILVALIERSYSDEEVRTFNNNVLKAIAGFKQ